MLSDESIRFCFGKEFHAFGTAWHFEQRAQRLRMQLKVLSWMSLAVPIAVGTLLGTLDGQEIVKYTRIVSGLLGGVLALAGLAALVGNWTDSLAGSERSMLENTKLSEAWRDLKSYTGADSDTRLATLKERDAAQQAADQLSGISAKEKRRMMRATLLQYRLPCEACKQVPASLKADKSTCAVCANF